MRTSPLRGSIHVGAWPHRSRCRQEGVQAGGGIYVMRVAENEGLEIAPRRLSGTSRAGKNKEEAEGQE